VSEILEFASKNNYQNKVELLGIPDNFIEHGSVSELQHKIGLDANSLAKLFSKT
jgi:1-deoxy-D-xylulose-5-phosphate synthase